MDYRDPCDGCDGTCGDVCPVLEAKRLNDERAAARTRDMRLGWMKVDCVPAEPIRALIDESLDEWTWPPSYATFREWRDRLSRAARGALDPSASGSSDGPAVNVSNPEPKSDPR